MEKIGFGGGCHWCTEAIFLSLKGVKTADQGWIAGEGADSSFSEAVIVHFDPAEIDLSTLIAVHLYTHSSTSRHALRNRYRSAIYFFSAEQEVNSFRAIHELQTSFDKPLVTEVIPFISFKPSIESEKNYYYKDPAKPFCETHINPKLKIVLQQFSGQANREKLSKLCLV